MTTSKRERKERIPLPTRLDYNPQLEELATFNRNHRELLELNTDAGCYHCCTIFPPEDIKEWIRDESTALCPNCGIDAVLPNGENELTIPILQAMHDYWFVSAYSFRIKDGEVLDVLDEDGLYDPIEFAEYRERVIEANKNQK